MIPELNHLNIVVFTNKPLVIYPSKPQFRKVIKHTRLTFPSQPHQSHRLPVFVSHPACIVHLLLSSLPVQVEEIIYPYL